MLKMYCPYKMHTENYYVKLENYYVFTKNTLYYCTTNRLVWNGKYLLITEEQECLVS